MEDFQLPASSKQMKDDEEMKSAVEDKKVSKNCVLAAAFSVSGKYFAIGDDQKQLHVYKALPKWELVSSRCMARRCTALTFPHNEKEVVVADRTGDVCQYSLIDSDGEGVLLLGHLSMVLDVVITSKDKYIVTCDRDEKIRISHYPNAYNIHAYCLLHTEYISQVVYVEELDCIISGSGDGRLACWSLDGVYLNSIQVQSKDMKNKVKGEGLAEGKGQLVEEMEESPGVKRIVYDEVLQILGVIYYSSKQLDIFAVETGEDGCHLTKNSHHALLEEPWDICFDSQHRLWVLQPSEQSPVTVLVCDRNDQGIVEVCNTGVDKMVQDTLNLICGRWPFFQASLECQKQFISLQKIRTHENIQRYLEKKEERINTQQNKTQPPQKRMKTS